MSTRAAAIFHETYHWCGTVSQPPANHYPETYKPEEVVLLAAQENTEGARLNAESWAQAAMAMFVQQTFNLDLPPVPKGSVSAEVQSHLSILGISNQTLKSIVLNQMPDWFAPPVVQGAPEFKPDMVHVVQLSSIDEVPLNSIDDSPSITVE